MARLILMYEMQSAAVKSGSSVQPSNRVYAASADEHLGGGWWIHADSQDDRAVWSPTLATFATKGSEQMITSVHSFVATVDLISALKRLTTPPSWCWQHMTAITCKYSYIIRPIWMLSRFHCHLSKFPSVSKNTEKREKEIVDDRLRCIIYPAPFGFFPDRFNWSQENFLTSETTT